MSFISQRLPVKLRVTCTIVISLALVFTSIVFINCLLIERYHQEPDILSVQYTATLNNANERSYSDFQKYIEDNQISDEKAYAAIPLILRNSRNETMDVLLITSLNENREDVEIYQGDGRLTNDGVLMDFITNDMLFTPSPNSFYDKEHRNKIYTDNMREITVDGVVEYAGITVNDLSLYASKSFFFYLSDSFDQLVFVFDKPLSDTKENMLISGIRNYFDVIDISISQSLVQTINRDNVYITLLLLIALSIAVLGVLRLFRFIVQARKNEYFIRVLLGATAQNIFLEQMKFLFILFIPSVIMGSLSIWLSEIATPDILLFPNLSFSMLGFDMIPLFLVLFVEEAIFALDFSRKLRIRRYGDI